MADLLPSSPDPSAGEGGDPRVIGVDSEDAAVLLSALQSETARDILAALYDDPATPSALAEAADTSIQNVRYHLEKLTDADLVAVVDTVYSEKGREMNVYAPAAKPLVVFAGGDDETSGIETALSRLLGALGVLGASSLLVQRLFGGANTGGDFGPSYRGEDYGPGPSAGENQSGQAGRYDDAEAEAPEEDDVELYGSDDAETATESGDAAEVAEEAETATDTATTIAEETTRYATTTVADGSADATAGLEPGLLFFLGGTVVLLALGLAWYARAR